MKRLTDYIAESFKRPSAGQTGQNKSVKPRTKDELEKIIKDAFAHKQYNLNFIDTSYITDMSELFKGVEHNFDVTDWDVSHVTDMSFMFADCTHFNCDLSVWNVHCVTNMLGMFEKCKILNCDLSAWDTRNVKDMKYMFYRCRDMKVPSWYRE